jgi:hypothetical protein
MRIIKAPQVEMHILRNNEKCVAVLAKRVPVHRRSGDCHLRSQEYSQAAHHMSEKQRSWFGASEGG